MELSSDNIYMRYCAVVTVELFSDNIYATLEMGSYNVRVCVVVRLSHYNQ